MDDLHCQRDDCEGGAQAPWFTCPDPEGPCGRAVEVEQCSGLMQIFTSDGGPHECIVGIKRSEDSVTVDTGSELLVLTWNAE